MKRMTKIMCVAICCVMLFALLPLSACSKKSNIVIMEEELSGLFNPFYATSGSDQDIIGMTQIGMMTTDSDGNIAFGEDEACVVLDYDLTEDTNGDSVYTFVIKNGLYFSNGSPLTMNDVMFNLYEYLDPVYTGSSTMYSTEIKGLSQYRTQTYYSDETGGTESQLNETAASAATLRIQELIDIFQSVNWGSSGSPSYSATESDMRDRINNWIPSAGYYSSLYMQINDDPDYSIARAQLLKDYEDTLSAFRDELEEDYISAKEAFDTTAAPYNSNEDLIKALESDVFKFMLYEGYVTIEYAIGSNGKKDTSTIEKFSYGYDQNSITTQEQAISKVYNDYVETGLDTVLSYWGTAATMSTQFAAEYTSAYLQSQTADDGSLLFPYVEGIVSLGHQRRETDVNTGESYMTWPYTSTTVNVNGTTYNIARDHNADGTPANEDEYDVLQITVNGVDPKAVYSFSFSVSPEYYYSGEKVDIAENQFGVKYADYSFQSDTIQGDEKNGVPMGAGPYKASDRNGSETSTRSTFWSAGNVFFKANRNFMFDVKEENIIFLEVSSSNAIDKLDRGEVDYAIPQFTRTNSDTLAKMKNVKTLDAWQLGYGYVGINAGKIPNYYLRCAIMSAMQVSLATDYYYPGQSEVIYWPMSKVSWAYPSTTNNGHDYTQWTGVDDAKQKIQDYMALAANNYGGYTENDLKITFTISGSSISDHPTYQVFLQAMELLNDCGWNVEVRADSQALTKLATGSLSVWAAAWGSTIDPDMYQVYHIDSTATSTYAWGYREIKANRSTYTYEYDIIKNKLSPVIDDARKTNDQADRKVLYQEAMGYVLDLAIELPVYQRKTLYAYNTKTIGGLNEDVNPYSTPLEKIWEIYLIK